MLKVSIADSSKPQARCCYSRSRGRARVTAPHLLPLLLCAVILLQMPVLAEGPYNAEAKQSSSSIQTLVTPGGESTAMEGIAPAGSLVAQIPAPGSLRLSDLERHRLKAAEEVKKEEHQRILRIMPDFYTSYIQDAEPLSRAQKFDLAMKSSFDPFSFAAAGSDAGISQAMDNFPAYGQGGKGYAKRFGASFADSFDGTMFGGWIFPVLLRQDPRYFRKGTGRFRSRLFYALITTTVLCKDDNRRWVFNYSNILGNLAAGSISNIYYPKADRGVVLTLQRTGVVMAEGALGTVFFEFWPDISSRLFRRRPKPGG